ncbi:MAG: hypothetical protein ACM3RX_07715 [Methanococcaceae archaeon]
MRNINILHYGRVKQANIYESIFEYMKGFDITQYETNYTDGQPEYFVEEWQPATDNDLYYEYDEMKDAGEIEIDGQKYTRINKGETQINYVPAESLTDTLYIIYHCDHSLRKCTGTGEIFQTEEEAEKRAKELGGK